MLTNGSVWKIGTLSIEKRLWLILETSKYLIQMWRKRCIKQNLFIIVLVLFIFSRLCQESLRENTSNPKCSWHTERLTTEAKRIFGPNCMIPYIHVKVWYQTLRTQNGLCPCGKVVYIFKCLSVVKTEQEYRKFATKLIYTSLFDLCGVLLR